MKAVLQFLYEELGFILFAAEADVFTLTCGGVCAHFCVCVCEDASDNTSLKKKKLGENMNFVALYIF